MPKLLDLWLVIWILLLRLSLAVEVSAMRAHTALGLSSPLLVTAEAGINILWQIRIQSILLCEL